MTNSDLQMEFKLATGNYPPCFSKDNTSAIQETMPYIEWLEEKIIKITTKNKSKKKQYSID